MEPTERHVQSMKQAAMALKHIADKIDKAEKGKYLYETQALRYFSMLFTVTVEDFFTEIEG